MKRTLTYIIASLTLLACSEKIDQPKPKPDKEPSDTTAAPDSGETAGKEDWPADKRGKSYIWDDSVIPEIHISISKTEWDRILTEADKQASITDFSKCNVTFTKDGENTETENVAIRLFENRMFNRPEGEPGESHNSKSPQWHFSSYELNFSKYNQKQTLRDIRRLRLKPCYNDPTYIREKFCHDTFINAGIWTVPKISFCRVWIHVSGDVSPAYLGVYQMIESMDDAYLKERITQLMGSTSGNLWSCSNRGTLLSAAFLKDNGASMNPDLSEAKDYNYILKTNLSGYNAAEKQLKDFISKVNTLKDAQFKEWISSVTDMSLMLKTMAMDVAVGNTDSYWCTGNNYHLYFTGKSTEDYKVFYIPGGFQMSLGSIHKMSQMSDSGTRDITIWGNKNGVLMNKIMSIEEFKDEYLLYLEDFITDDRLLKPSNAKERARSLSERISAYTSNDTGERNSVSDLPAPNTAAFNKYRLWKDGMANFFEEKAAAVRQYILDYMPIL